MKKGKILFLILLVGIFLSPLITHAADSCCVCTFWNGLEEQGDEVRLDNDGSLILDAGVCDSHDQVVVVNPYNPTASQRFACEIKESDLCVSTAPQTSKLADEFKFGNIILGIKIPDLRFSAPPTEVDEEGNIYIPWIGEYIKAIYNFSIVAISIIAVIVIIMQGLKISASAGGPAKGEAQKRIGQAVMGLFIAWGSYVILFAINPELTQLRSLNIKFIEHVYFEEPAEEIESTRPEIKVIKKANKSERKACLANLPSSQVGISLKDYDIQGDNPDGKHGARYVQVNALMGEDLKAVFTEISQQTDYKIKAAGGQRGSGPCTAGSMHRCGLAIDINPGDNPDCPARAKDKRVGQYWDVAGDHRITEEELEKCKNGEQITDIPPKVVEIFERHGFYWGGYGWGKADRSDAMHFEYHRYCYM